MSNLIWVGLRYSKSNKILVMEFSSSLMFRTLLPLQGAWVQCLAGELRTSKLCNTVKTIYTYVYTHAHTHIYFFHLLKTSALLGNY